MELCLIRPLGMQLFPIAWIELMTSTGSFIVHKNHAPEIVTFAHNSTISFVLTSGKQESVVVPHGIAEITREKVTIFLPE